MRFSVVALAGLAALGNPLGAQARATPNELGISQPFSGPGDAALSMVEDIKRRLVSVLPRAVAPVRPINPIDPPPVRPGGPDPVDGPPPAAKPNPAGDGPDAPAKPAPLRPGSEPGPEAGAVCRLQRSIPKRSRIFGRTTYTRADAANVDKVMQWMAENEDYFKSRGHSADRVVFFSTGQNGKGEDMANAFVDKNPSYAMFDDIFASKFSKDFGGVAPREGDVGIATSKALARWCKNPIVFNTASALPHSYWVQYELPEMTKSRTGTITKMKDDATSLDQTDGTIEPPKAC